MLRLTVQEIQSIVGEKAWGLDLLAPWLRELMAQHSFMHLRGSTETAQIRNKTSNDSQGLPLAACFLQPGQPPKGSTASANHANS